MKTLAAVAVATCLGFGSAATAQTAAAPTAPSATDYANALMDLDCPTCEGKVENLRGFSLAGPSAAHAQAKPAAPRATRTALTGAKPAAPQGGLSAADLRLNFRLGSAELTSEGEANASNFAQALKDPRLADRSFVIVGHTDATGPAETNLKLSQARAEAVKAYLVKAGVSSDRLETRGVGSADLAVPSNPTAAANRRVEVRRAG